MVSSYAKICNMESKEYIKRSLIDFGLTEGEARVYLAMMDSFGADVSFIKGQTKYSNAGVYKIINSLLDKGFIELTQSTYPAKYFPVPLSKIAEKFVNKGRKLGRVAQKFRNLDRLQAIPDESAEIYEDASFTDFYLDMPYKMDDGFLCCIGSFIAVKNFLGIDTEKEFINKRVKKGIQCDALIFDDNDESRKIAGTDKSKKRDSRFITGYDYPEEFTYVFGDTTVTFYRDADGKVKILKTDSPQLARAKLLQYQMLWKSTQE